MSYDWLENAILKTADGKLVKEAKIISTSKGDIVPGIYQDIVQQTGRIYPGEGFISITVPTKPVNTVTVTKENTNAAIITTDIAYFDSKNGMLIKKIPFGELGYGARIRRMILPVHSGSLLGWPGKTLALLVSMFTASLPVTGFLIWWGKRKKKGDHYKQLLSITSRFLFKNKSE